MRYIRMFVAGMVSKKHNVDATQAHSLGMLLPAEGLAILREIIWCPSDVELWGAASKVYWRLFLRGQKEQIAMFANIYELTKNGKEVSFHLTCLQLAPSPKFKGRPVYKKWLCIFKPL